MVWALSTRVRFSLLIKSHGFPSSSFRSSVKQVCRLRPNSDWAVLGLKQSVWKIVTTLYLSSFLFDVVFKGQTDNLRKKFSDRFQKVPIRSQQGFLLYS